MHRYRYVLLSVRARARDGPPGQAATPRPRTCDADTACLQERETIMRHEVTKARERKAQLEARLTKVENSMYGRYQQLAKHASQQLSQQGSHASGHDGRG